MLLFLKRLDRSFRFWKRVFMDGLLLGFRLLNFGPQLETNHKGSHGSGQKTEES
ncbi:Uncharacterised protein [Mycobacterium tuberculosis]|nr:Uncharacterised protein [Mycobacterium tuberculosis]